MPSARRSFLKGAAGGAIGLVQIAPAQTSPPPPAAPAAKAPSITYPRKYSGRSLAMVAMPLGGLGAGSISIGGRGQLRDWEIYNRPDKGLNPNYAFPAIFVESAGKKTARVLEARYLPPYEGASGLGSNNAPGLRRMAAATFTSEFPLARVDFRDARVPVSVSLEAFTPFIPLDVEESGLPVIVLRYRVKNPQTVKARVSIAYSLDNPAGFQAPGGKAAGRKNEWRETPALSGFRMTNPSLDETDVLYGSFALGLLDAAGSEVSQWSGWPRRRWWDSPMLFWDDFGDDGKLGPEPTPAGTVAALCQAREIAPGAEATYTFVLAWHFPNRTPERCSWSAPKDKGATVIGNYYAKRFADAWAAADYTARNLAALEQRTRAFLTAVRESTLPGAVKDAAMSNLTTLVTTTCFRTADGEFHGFEGVNDKAGCCYGNCTHVWNYETATAHLFPAFSVSLRRAAFGYSLDDAGAIHFRQKLPDGYERSGFAAADGQMGQIIKTYMDWKLSGDMVWLRGVWPRARKALEFCWVKNGWDADRDGVMEGVQHNTYDVEFYGPNPQCGVYYLAALRAAAEMARAVNDAGFAQECDRLLAQGREWIDKNLYNGSFYVQKIRGVKRGEIAPALMSSMGSENTEQPEYQMGDGCLADQLIGQYLADVCGLGPLLDPGHIKTTLATIYRRNFKRDLSEHDNVQRTFALNDEAALLICDYRPGERPRIPFPYYAELFTGIEYTAAAGMMYAGLVNEGLEVFEAVRRRYDGERRNPFDEAECGHHYARAMAAWSGLLALSGFDYFAPEGRLAVKPRVAAAAVRSFWSTGTGWGSFEWKAGALTVKVQEGRLALRQVSAGAKELYKGEEVMLSAGQQKTWS